MAGVKYEFSYVLGETFQSPQQQDWTLYRNTTFELDLNVVDAQEEPVDLTGWCAELIIEYICAFDVIPPGRGKIVKYKLIANRTTDIQYFNTKYGSFVVDDANGNIKFKLTSFGTSKENTDATFFGTDTTNRFIQVEGPLLCNEAKYELRFKYTDPESNDDTYLRPLFGNITFVNTHVSTEDGLPCEDKIDFNPTLHSLEVVPAGDPNTYQSGDDLILTKLILLNSNLRTILAGDEKVCLYINDDIFHTFNSNIESVFSYTSNLVEIVFRGIGESVVVDGDEITMTILKTSGQQLVSNTLVVSSDSFVPRTLYFNHNETIASWNKLEYWYEDENFQIPATELPKSIDSVIITSSINYPSSVTVYQLTVNGPQLGGQQLIYKVPTTINKQAIFNGYTVVKSDLRSTIVNANYSPVVFNDNSEAGANINGNIAVPINITTITREVEFNDNSKNYASLPNATFKDYSQNASTAIYDNIVLSSPLEGRVRRANFYNNSKNYGIVGGQEVFLRESPVNSPICATEDPVSLCRNWISSGDRSSVVFFDNACHYGPISTTRLPTWSVPGENATPSIRVLDTAHIFPYPPPTCIS